MNDIFQKQNTPEFITRFRAQGRSYDKAKKYNSGIVCVSVIFVAFFSILGIVFPDSKVLQCVSVVYSACATVYTFVAEYLCDSKKDLAVRIQQLIDSDLFGLKWDKIWGHKPILDEIMKAAEGEPQDRYVNWYDEAIDRVNKIAAITICFRINTRYDHELRDKYMNSIHICFWSVVIVALFGAMLFDVSLANTLWYGILPALPIIIFYAKIWIACNKDKKYLEEVQKNIDELQEDLISGKRVSSKALFSIQTLILQHRRACIDIPTWFYKRNRTKNEDSNHEFAMKLADRLLQNPGLVNQ